MAVIGKSLLQQTKKRWGQETRYSCSPWIQRVPFALSDSLLLCKVSRFDSRAGSIVARSQEKQATWSDKTNLTEIAWQALFFISKGLVVIH